MIDNRVFLVMVIGIATLSAVGMNATLTGYQNDHNNMIHDKVFVKLNVIYNIIDEMINKTGGVQENIDRENKHFNTSIINAGKLDKIIELLKDINNTDNSGICPPELNVSSNVRCPLVN